MPFLVVLIFWLTIIFGSFGLFAKPSATVFGSLFVFALSAAGAIYLVLELGQPFAGLMQISSAPLRNALTPLSPYAIRMIGVAGQNKPRLLSRSSRPAAAAFRIDQDARRAEMSKSGTFHTWPWCAGMSVREDRADNNMKRSNVCRWCLPMPDCHRRRRRTFRNYRENCRARDHRPARDRTRSSRWFSG